MRWKASDIEVPNGLAYDMAHYEPLVPDTEHDVQKTIQLKKAVIQGIYEKDKVNISFLSSLTASTSYASVVKSKGNKGTFKKVQKVSREINENDGIQTKRQKTNQEKLMHLFVFILLKII